MSSSVNKIRYALVGLLIAAGLALAPSAFARGHVDVGINIGLPGISLGYSDYGWRGGGYAYGGYAPAYAPVYYGPSYPPPVYYSRPYYPAYGVVYSPRYYRGPARPYYRGDRGYRNDYGHRGRYYDRGGYRGR